MVTLQGHSMAWTDKHTRVVTFPNMLFVLPSWCHLTTIIRIRYWYLYRFPPHHYIQPAAVACKYMKVLSFSADLQLLFTSWAYSIYILYTNNLMKTALVQSPPQHQCLCPYQMSVFFSLSSLLRSIDHLTCQFVPRLRNTELTLVEYSLPVTHMKMVEVLWSTRFLEPPWQLWHLCFWVWDDWNIRSNS